MGRLTRLSLFLLSLGAGLGAFAMSGPASSAHPMVDGSAFSETALVPVAPATVAAPTQVTVKAGDTLSALGATLGRTWQQLAGWNHLNWSQAQDITVGQVLKIPAADYVAPSLSPPPAVSAPAHSYAQGFANYQGSSWSGVAACIARVENGGSYGRSTNPTHFGRYQFSYDTWKAYGGNPADWGYASPAEQDAVFARAMASPGGYLNWTPYDGC